VDASTRAALAVVIATPLTVGAALPAEAGSRRTDHAPAAARTSASASATRAVPLGAVPERRPFTVRVTPGPTAGSADGARFSGTGTPGGLVVVHYSAPDPATGAAVRRVAHGTGSVGADGTFSFTADFPELPAGSPLLSYRVDLVVPARAATGGRIDGTLPLG